MLLVATLALGQAAIGLAREPLHPFLGVASLLARGGAPCALVAVDVRPAFCAVSRHGPEEDGEGEKRRDAHGLLFPAGGDAPFERSYCQTEEQRQACSRP